jgi:hypothetical protein
MKKLKKNRWLGWLTLVLLATGPSVGWAQNLLLQLDNEWTYTEGKTPVSAKVFTVQNFSGRGPEWSQLEQHWNKLSQTPGVNVLFVYSNPMEVPRLEYFMADFDPENPSTQVLRDLIEEITPSCVLIAYKTGRKGAFLQNPTNQKQHLLDLLKQFEQQFGRR